MESLQAQIERTVAKRDAIVILGDLVFNFIGSPEEMKHDRKNRKTYLRDLVTQYCWQRSMAHQSSSRSYLATLIRLSDVANTNVAMTSMKTPINLVGKSLAMARTPTIAGYSNTTGGETG